MPRMKMGVRVGLKGVDRFLKNSAPYLINIHYRLLCGTLHLLQCIVLIFICICSVGSCWVGSCLVVGGGGGGGGGAYKKPR